MKKILLLIFFLFSLLKQLNAKQKFGIDFSVGVKGGVNINEMQGLGWKKDIYHTNPHAGFFMHINKKHIGFQLEALWSQSQGVSDTNFKQIYKQYINHFSDSLNAGNFRFNMISLPILLNIKFAQWFWIQAGPQFDANINVLDKNKIIKSGVNIINQNNYSGVVGVWFQLGGKAPVVRVNFGARYITSLNNLNSFQTNGIWKNQCLQIHLGLSY